MLRILLTTLVLLLALPAAAHDIPQTQLRCDTPTEMTEALDQVTDVEGPLVERDYGVAGCYYDDFNHLQRNRWETHANGTYYTVPQHGLIFQVAMVGLPDGGQDPVLVWAGRLNEWCLPRFTRELHHKVPGRLGYVSVKGTLTIPTNGVEWPENGPDSLQLFQQDVMGCGETDPTIWGDE